MNIDDEGHKWQNTCQKPENSINPGGFFISLVNNYLIILLCIFYITTIYWEKRQQQQADSCWRYSGMMKTKHRVGLAMRWLAENS